MLLTITMYGDAAHPATDLGYLLHKHPDRVQTFNLSVGTATVFFPEATSQRCTCTLLLEIDQQRLAKQARQGIGDFALAQYVNDRSYAAGSMLGAALSRVFSTARSGRCDSHQALANNPVPLEIVVPVLPARGGVADVRRVFAPLGWEVAAQPISLDSRFPGWGNSSYVHLTLRGNVRLADTLNQLTILLPVLDEAKHYWQNDDEIAKLLRMGEGWLATHPEREFITRKYLARSREHVNIALARLTEHDDGLAGDFSGDTGANTGEGMSACEAIGCDGQHQVSDHSGVVVEVPAGLPLRVQRQQAVLTSLLDLGAKTVLDLGCGPGDLLVQLAKQSAFTKVTGVDVSARALQTAAHRLHFDELSDHQANRLTLFQGALTYSDKRFAGYDAAVLMEVIEHIDLPRLPALTRVVFGEAKPGSVIITTPNQEYNARYLGLETTDHRHTDHRFEWTRAEFHQWAQAVAAEYGYAVRFADIGDVDAEVGAPTQMGVFTHA